MRSFAVLVSLSLCAVAVAEAPPGNISRGIYCPPGPLLSTSFWGRHGTGFSFTAEAAHTGTHSLKVETPSATGPGGGVVQLVQFKQTTPAPIKISGWSKAVDVAEAVADHRYSIYLDLTHTDGTPLHMKIAAFPGGTHDWVHVETLVTPEKPLASARVYVFLRGRTGAVFFDDLFVGPSDGPNLLRNAGFEPGDRDDPSVAEGMYRTYADLNANALHTYLSGEPSFWRGPDGEGNVEVRRFLQEARRRGIGVWLTTGAPGQPPFKDAADSNFPQYVCVNGAWGQAWTESLALAATYDFAGISLVPDEYNWTNAPLTERYGKHSDPKVAEFYGKLPAMCNCPVCAEFYEKTYGEKLPPLELGMRFPAQTLPYLRYLKQRYDSTTAWMARSAAAVKRANPKIRADSLICVSPICSDMWWGTGVAWDRVGAETDIDFPTTDPYILLHNYLGDSTHWYVTETAAHLTGCTPKRQCGIVLEASRLRQEYRELDPVEIYGSALSAVAHGAKELAWWHYSHLTDESRTTDRSEVSRACVRGVYGLLKDADPWLAGLRPTGHVAVLHSRAADDMWRFYANRDASERPEDDPRYAAVAQKEILYYLFRRGIPADLRYLEAVQEPQLRDARAIIVPFPFAIADKQVALLRKLAESGKTIIVIGQQGELDEMGVRRDRPALAELLAVGGQSVEPAARQLGRGRIVFLPSDYGYGLPLHRDNQKRTRTERIQPDPLNPERVAVLDAVLKEACGGVPWVLAQMPSQDVEATALRNAAGETVVLAINWESEAVPVELVLPATGPAVLSGYRLGPDGQRTSSALKAAASGGKRRVKLTLQPQEACLWHGK